MSKNHLKEETERELSISQACRDDIRKCTIEEFIIVMNTHNKDASFDAIGEEVREEVENTLLSNIALAIALVIGIQISLLFELYVIPLIPIGGFWGIMLTILLFIGLLAGFTLIKIVYKRRIRKKVR